MFLAYDATAFSVGIFHLITDAFFKGLLLLVVEFVIHAVGGEQDMRKMGGLRKHIPWTFWTMTIATFAIAGIPPLAGFFSKDEILWRAYQMNWVYWLVGLITAFITSFYMFRLWFMTFFGEYRGAAESAHGHDHPSRAGVPAPHRHGHGGIHESPKVMLVPLVILAVLSFAGGWVGIVEALGGHDYFEKFLSPVFHSSTPVSNVERAVPGETSLTGTESAEQQSDHATELAFTVISVVAGLLGLFLAWLLYSRVPGLPDRIADSIHGLYSAVAHKYWVDEMYAALLVTPLIAVSRVFFWRTVDQGVI